MKRSIANRMAFLAALAGIVFALAGFAHAGAIIKEQPQKVEKAKKGTLMITATTHLGGITLEPGEYEVKQKDTKNGPVVRFILYTYNPYAQEGQSVHQWDVIGEARVNMQSRDSKATRTQLLSDFNGDQPIGLQIRGNSFDYVFLTA
jgi:hypothetical protein